MNCCLDLAVRSNDPIEGLPKCLAPPNGRGNLWSMDTASSVHDPVSKTRNEVFAQALQQLGWSVGDNLKIEIRNVGRDLDHLSRYAAELIALTPDVIVSVGGVTVTPVQQGTRTIPIVFVNAPDPVGAGFVQSMARPGGNITGFLNFEYSMSGKWAELLRQIAPNVARALVFRDPTTAAGIGQFGAVRSVAQSGVRLLRRCGKVPTRHCMVRNESAPGDACHRHPEPQARRFPAPNAGQPKGGRGPRCLNSTRVRQ